MIHLKRLVCAVLAACGVAVLGFPSAEAAERVPFTIVETDILPQIDLPPTFESSDPLCPFGYVLDQYRARGRDAQPFGAFIIRTEYVCLNGTGSFYASKRIVFGETNGRVQLAGGTGQYTDLRGHGTFSRTNVDDVGGAPATLTTVSGVLAGK